MKKIITAAFILSLLVVNCSREGSGEEGPGLELKMVKIIHPDGVAVRSNPNGTGKRISVAHENYTYDVIDVLPIYYEVQYKPEKTGFIYANTAKNWTEKTAENRINVNYKPGITVRTRPYKKGSDIGSVTNGDSFELVSEVYSYVKIRLPDAEGWIYVGKPGSDWVEFIY